MKNKTMLLKIPSLQLKRISCCLLHSKTHVTNLNKSEITVNALETVPEDVSSVTSHFPKSFNLAAYVNHSETLQNLMYYNVNLSKIEHKPHIAINILKLEEQNIKKHILFFNDYVDSKELGNFITKNPMILCESLQDLEIRVNYLQSKQFSSEQIKRIISKNPFWLMFNTTRIDKRLGFYQEYYSLCGQEVRFLASRQPNIITYNLHHIKCNTFVIKEEMGFEDHEIKQLILAKPKLWMIDQKKLLDRFNYFHNVIKISHKIILDNPEILLCRNFKVKQRHMFLQKLGRAQYNATKENYVPVKALVEGSDMDFCNKHAKCNIDDFNIFLKTL